MRSEFLDSLEGRHTQSYGQYLDMANNDGCNGCSPNENCREGEQLFTVGLVAADPDGTPQVDGHRGRLVYTDTRGAPSGWVLRSRRSRSFIRTGYLTAGTHA